MSRNLKHLTSIHEAAQELHKRLLGVPWFIRCQVFSQSPERAAATDKREKREIVVYVKDLQAAEVGGMTTFNSWPVRYEQGV